MAIQGDVLEHVDALKLAMARLGLEGSVKAVKRSVDLEKLDCVVIPGGESTVIGRVAERKGLLGALKKRIEDGLPVFGTCAGAILLAKEVYDAKVGEVDQPLLKVMDVRIARNYYGRQRESFEVDLHIPVLGEKPFRGVFIRAPAIESVGSGVEVLATYEGLPVLVKQGLMLAATFHPELTSDTRIHEYFLSLAKRS